MDEKIKDKVENIGNYLLEFAPESIQNDYNDLCNWIIEMWMERNGLLSYYHRKRGNFKIQGSISGRIRGVH